MSSSGFIKPVYMPEVVFLCIRKFAALRYGGDLGIRD